MIKGHTYRKRGFGIYGLEVGGHGLARSTQTCMRVHNSRGRGKAEEGTRACEACGNEPDLVHVPVQVAGAYCPNCCPCCGQGVN